MKKKNKIEISTMAVTTLCLAALIFCSESALAADGLQNHFSISAEGGSANFGKLGYQDINNIDYNSLDASFNGSLKRLNSAGDPIYNALFRSKGEIHIPADGDYKFRVVAGTNNRKDLRIHKKDSDYLVVVTTYPGAFSSSCVSPSCEIVDWRDCCNYFNNNALNIDEGWYELDFYNHLWTSDDTGQAKLFWIKPNGFLHRTASQVLASSQTPGKEPSKCVDGSFSTEWATNGQKVGASIELRWPQPVTLNKIVLKDRRDLSNQITGGTLVFSDGSSIPTGALNNDGAVNTFDFPAKSITSVRLDVSSVSASTASAGLTEFEAYFEEIIPESAFSAGSWGNSSDILIPASGPNQQIDFLTTGVWTLGDSSTSLLNPDPKIEINLPAGKRATGDATTDVLDQDVWVFWNNEDAAENNLTVRNIHTGATANVINVERIQTVHGNKSADLRGKIPSNLVVDNGAGNLAFRFLNVDEDYTEGIALVLVYRDATKPFGKLTIKTPGEDVYNNASSVLAFDTSDGLPLNQAKPKPFFIFRGGQSKPVSVYRPTYLSMTKGSGGAPGRLDFFAQAGASNKIIPELAGSPALGADRWYPMYGREGEELDVLAMSGNYAGGNEGILDQGIFAGGEFGIADTDTWVAFQLASSQLPEDGISPPVTGSNDSGGIMAIGMLTYSAPAGAPESFKVCPTTTTNITVGNNQSFVAYYWDNYNSSGDDCTAVGGFLADGIADNRDPLDVTIPSTWTVVSGLTSVVSYVSQGVFKGEGVGSDTIKAEYTPATTLTTLSDTVDVNVFNLPCSKDCSNEPNVCSGVIYLDPSCGENCTGTKDCSFNYVED